MAKRKEKAVIHHCSRVTWESGRITAGMARAAIKIIRLMNSMKASLAITSRMGLGISASGTMNTMAVSSRD